MNPVRKMHIYITKDQTEKTMKTKKPTENHTTWKVDPHENENKHYQENDNEMHWPPQMK